MKKDLFGFETQGKKYDIYRPKYPPEMLQKLIAKTKHRNRYLDVATGTGQILFEIAHHFNQKMIDVCEAKAKQKQLKEVVFKCENFEQKQLLEKYDLITIGQALHWLPITDFLVKCKQGLTGEGNLTVFGYILNSVQAESTAEWTQKLQALYYSFYDKKVKASFDFDRNELHNHYSDEKRYPFNKIFPFVERQLIKVPINMDKNGFISYLQTYSGYNTYLEKHSQQEDPIQAMVRQIPQDLKIICNFDYFSIRCSLKQE